MPATTAAQESTTTRLEERFFIGSMSHLLAQTNDRHDEKEDHEKSENQSQRDIARAQRTLGRRQVFLLCHSASRCYRIARRDAPVLPRDQIAL